MTPSRRSILAGASAGLMLATAAGSAAFARAGAGAQGILVLIILRGAMDGLAAVAPQSDPNYRRLRGDLALPEPGAPGGTLPLIDGFGLHPALTTLHGLWRQRQMSFVHAVATPYRDRSHFDGQDVLEWGKAGLGSNGTGWLNRAQAVTGAPRGAVAIGRTVPMVLRGPNPATSWAPPLAPETDADTLARLQDLYAYDDQLGQALARAIATDAIADAGAAMADSEGAGDTRQRRGIAYAPLAEAAARLLTAPDGPKACVLSFDGWDTHARQGASEGQLAVRLRQLDLAVAALRDGLGARWSQTTCVIATEFGRTVRVNGSAGTDHGTGGAAFVLGGGLSGPLAGGRMMGEWPGLGRLHQDRDLIPANDLTVLFAQALGHAWGGDAAGWHEAVFKA